MMDSSVCGIRVVYLLHKYQYPLDVLTMVELTGRSVELCSVAH